MRYVPWTEKYRAKKIDQIYSQPFISRLKTQLSDPKNDAICHFIFHGSPGCGKTSSAQAICRDLFGPEIYSERILELNANDEGGIGLVRDKIKYFASLKIGKRDLKYMCPDIKVIILDEADALTVDAQAALRYIIENNGKTTRFMFMCNDIRKFSDAMISRCFVYKFNRVSDDAIKNKLTDIISQENIQIDESSNSIICNIVKHSEGDMRKAINVLQGCSQNRSLDGEMLHNITGMMTIEQEDKLEKLLCGEESNRSALFDYTESILKSGVDPTKVLDKLILFFMNKTGVQNPIYIMSIKEQHQLLMKLMKSTSGIHNGFNPNLIIWRAAFLIQSALNHTQEGTC